MWRRASSEPGDSLERIARRRRLEATFGDEAATEQDLADDLVEAGESVTEEQVAELRRRVGAWLPTVRDAPYRRVWRRSAEHTAALGELVAQAEQARAALEVCGRARAAAYAAYGRSPDRPVSLSGSDEPAEEAAAIEDALRARRASEQATAAGVPSERDRDPMQLWDQRRQEVRAQLVLVERARDQLPQRDRTARRMLGIWMDLATMRLGHGQNDRDMAALEDTAWQLLSALPADRCPRWAPRMLAREYRRWDRRQFDAHREEFAQYAEVGKQLKGRKA